MVVLQDRALTLSSQPPCKKYQMKGYNNVLTQCNHKFNNSIRDKVLPSPSGGKSFWSLANNVSLNFRKSSFPSFIPDDEEIATI